MLEWLGYWSSPQQGWRELQYHQNKEMFSSEANSSFLVFPLLWTGDAVDVAQSGTAGVVTPVWVQQFYYHLSLNVLCLSVIWSKWEPRSSFNDLLSYSEALN